MPANFYNNINNLSDDAIAEINAELLKAQPMINPNQNPSDQKAAIQKHIQGLQQTQDIASKEKKQSEDMINDINKSQSLTRSESYFSLNKFSQMNQNMSVNDSSLSANDLENSENNILNTEDMDSNDLSNESLSFSSDVELKNWLIENKDNPEKVEQFLEQIPVESNFTEDNQTMNIKQFVRDSIQRFYQPETSKSDQSILAAEIYKKVFNDSASDSVPAEYVKFAATGNTKELDEISDLVKQTENEIKEFAKIGAETELNKQILANNSNEKKPFNLKKIARRSGFEYTLFGPDSRRVLPYGNQGILATDWDVYERNKGNNFFFADNYAIDFETFWRGNIMDKYSRPYRNEKGEWVGGYINKRFEVDRNIPEGNNLQLLPGQIRRPYLPNFGLTEARLEAARDESNKERGYSVASPGSTFNWKKASVQKKK